MIASSVNEYDQRRLRSSFVRISWKARQPSSSITSTQSGLGGVVDQNGMAQDSTADNATHGWWHLGHLGRPGTLRRAIYIPITDRLRSDIGSRLLAGAR